MQASAHILLLLLALLLESYLRLQHRRRQAAGYLAFYWRTRSLLPLATRVTALGQVLLLLCPRALQGQVWAHFICQAAQVLRTWFLPGLQTDEHPQVPPSTETERRAHGTPVSRKEACCSCTY